MSCRLQVLYPCRPAGYKCSTLVVPPATSALHLLSCRTWLTAELGPEATAKHMVAVSTNLKLVQAFGIDPKNAFGFWDWVGGRYSVTSAVGMVPLSLQYGFAVMEEFLQGQSGPTFVPVVWQL